MPKLITNCIAQEQQDQLEQIRDTDKRLYMRERAAAMLKIAEGATPRSQDGNSIKELLNSRCRSHGPAFQHKPDETPAEHYSRTLLW